MSCCNCCLAHLSACRGPAENRRRLRSEEFTRGCGRQTGEQGSNCSKTCCTRSICGSPSPCIWRSKDSLWPGRWHLWIGTSIGQVDGQVDGQSSFECKRRGDQMA